MTTESLFWVGARYYLSNFWSLIGEIVETCGFNADNTYVFFDTFLPEGWAFEDANAEETFGTVRDEHAEHNKR